MPSGGPTNWVGHSRAWRREVVVVVNSNRSCWRRQQHAFMLLVRQQHAFMLLVRQRHRAAPLPHHHQSCTLGWQADPADPADRWSAGKRGKAAAFGVEQRQSSRRSLTSIGAGCTQCRMYDPDVCFSAVWLRSIGDIVSILGFGDIVGIIDSGSASSRPFVRLPCLLLRLYICYIVLYTFAFAFAFSVTLNSYFDSYCAR